jgi:4-hydroxy-tetrahydrodipicolinate synthase
MSALVASWHAGDWTAARRIHDHYLPLMRANFQGAPNPVPVKAAMALMGVLDCDAFRAPLLPLAEPHRSRLAGILRDAGVLPADAATTAGFVGGAA